MMSEPTKLVIVDGDAGRLLVTALSKASTGGRQQRKSSGSAGDEPKVTEPKRTGTGVGDLGAGATVGDNGPDVGSDTAGEGDLGVSSTSMPSSSHRTSTESSDGAGVGDASTVAVAAAAVAGGGVEERVGDRDRNPLSPVAGEGAGPRRQAMPQSSSSSQSESSETGTLRALAAVKASRSSVPRRWKLNVARSTARPAASQR